MTSERQMRGVRRLRHTSSVVQAGMLARRMQARLVAERGLIALLRLQRAGYTPLPGQPDLATLYLQALARLDAAAAAAVLRCLNDAHKE